MVPDGLENSGGGHGDTIGGERREGAGGRSGREGRAGSGVTISNGGGAGNGGLHGGITSLRVGGVGRGGGIGISLPVDDTSESRSAAGDVTSMNLLRSWGEVASGAHLLHQLLVPAISAAVVHTSTEADVGTVHGPDVGRLSIRVLTRCLQGPVGCGDADRVLCDCRGEGLVEDALGRVV